MGEIRRRVNWLGPLAIIVVLTVFWGMREQAVIRRSTTYNRIAGETMGTFYSIKLAYSDIESADLDRLRVAIEQELSAIEQSMSTYVPSSEISRFNRMPAGEVFEAGPEFRSVIERALEFCELSRGAFDPTVGPLVNLWGFGNGGRRDTAPAKEKIDETMNVVGWRNIVLGPGRAISKRVDGLQIGLGAIAKGYAVDRIAALLSESGQSNYMVEVGGEVYADGLNSAGTPWRIGIDMPIPSRIPGARLYGVAEISNCAIATSGDYRNYFEAEDGSIYSHIIDPRTGSPARTPPASVSVLAEDCLTADALATALFVLGVDAGLELVEKLDGVEALFIAGIPGADFRESASSGFYSAAGYSRL